MIQPMAVPATSLGSHRGLRKILIAAFSGDGPSSYIAFYLNLPEMLTQAPFRQNTIFLL